MRVCNQIKDGIGKTLALFPPKRMALLLLGTAILSFGMHNIHRRVGITEGGVLGMVLLLDHQLSLPLADDAHFGYHLLPAGASLPWMGFY